MRLAFGRYVAPGTVTDGSDATRLLLQHLRAALPQQVGSTRDGREAGSLVIIAAQNAPGRAHHLLTSNLVG